jgi:peroxiredoxin
MVRRSMRFWLRTKQKSVFRRAAGLVAAVAMMQSGIPPAAQSAQATLSHTAAKGYAYELIPANSRVAAPDFTLTDLSGKTIALSEFKGKVVLLDFWGVECGGCKVEIPWYVAFDRTFRDKGLALIGIDMYGESLDLVRTFMAKAHMNYPIAIGNDALGERFHVEEMPLTLLIDRSGRIALSHSGIVDKTQFENDIRELLQ